jgi:Spy/CpxP family protein refolding chaperone
MTHSQTPHIRRARSWTALLTVALVTVGLLAVAALSAPAFAQPGADGDKPPAAHKARARKLRDKILRERVGLDSDKAAHVEKVLVDYQQRQRAIRNDIRESRQQLRALFKDDSNDQAAYRAALTKFRKAQADLASLRADGFAELDAKLTPKEQAKLLGTLAQVRRHLNRQQRVDTRRQERREKRKQKAPRQRRKP